MISITSTVITETPNPIDPEPTRPCFSSVLNGAEITASQVLICNLNDRNFGCAILSFGRHATPQSFCQWPDVVSVNISHHWRKAAIVVIDWLFVKAKSTSGKIWWNCRFALDEMAGPGSQVDACHAGIRGTWGTKNSRKHTEMHKIDM